jgi:hypothetical protein
MFPCGMKHAGSGQQMPIASAAAPIGTCNGFSTVDCVWSLVCYHATRSNSRENTWAALREG